MLDRLARESIRYTHAFTTAPVCAPSRAAIITGMYQTSIGAQHMRTTEDRVPELPGPYLAVPPHYVKAFPEYLRAAGYYTSNRAKTDYQFGVPFTIWDDLGPDAHWRNRPDQSQPFFSVFNLEVTHESQIFPTSPARKGKPLVTDPAASSVPPYYPDTPLVREELARMYDNIADMDGQVGEILRQLDADGLADNTIVFYWSDHGDGVPRSKRSLYDSGLRVPLMIRWPEMSAGIADIGQRSARQHDRSRADGAGARRRGDSRASPGARARRAEGGAAPEFVFGGARPHGHRIRHDALGARRALPLHPQLRARAALRGPHHLPEPERHHAGVAQAAGGTSADRSGRAVDADQPAGRGAVRHGCRSAPDPQSRCREMAHRQTLERMRKAVTDWMARTNDQGLINEPEMIQRMWPGGVQPETAQPYIVPRRELDAPSRRDVDRDQRRPIEVVIYVPTQGASIGYTTEEGPAAKWRLYTGPIRVDAPMTLRAKAIRYGYKESAETRTVFSKN